MRPLQIRGLRHPRTRDLPVGTRRFREDLQREKQLSADDAERVIQGQTQSDDLAGYVETQSFRSLLSPDASAFRLPKLSAGQLVGEFYIFL